MKSFQNRQQGFRSTQSRRCIHGRQSIRYLSTSQAQKTCQPKIADQNTPQCHQFSKSAVVDNPHTSIMKSIIAANQDYFQNKLLVPNDGKPSKLKLKIPSHTGHTIYKTDYKKNQESQVSPHGPIPNYKENKIKPEFFGNTTYRNEFLGVQNEDKNQNRKVHKYTSSDAPTFLQSQYKHNFLNWGSGSHMPSMKPHPNAAVTNLPFQPHTVYSAQFTQKPNKRTQNFKPGSQSAGLSLNNSSIISNQVPSPLFYMTTNSVFFDKKNNAKQNNLKPKTHTLTVGGNCFKGKTQYQSQFIKLKGSQIHQSNQKKPLSQLQNMIINL